MTWRRPILRINGQSSGKSLFDGPIGQAWTSCRVTDNEGQESDEAELVCADLDGGLTLPTKGQIFVIEGGWSTTGTSLFGVFRVEKTTRRGSPQSGREATIRLRAADFVDKLKGVGHQSWENSTIGDIMKEIGGAAGLPAVVAPDLASIPVPYALMWGQSRIDFATELVERHGGYVKPAGGKLAAMKRGSGQSAGGQSLPDIQITFRGCIEYEIAVEERPGVGNVAASWFDPASGRRKVVKKPTGVDGPYHILPHPYRDEAEATKAAESDAYDRGFSKGEGHFVTLGIPHARAGAAAITSGFGPNADGRFRASSVEHLFVKAEGYTTTTTIGGENTGG